MVEYEERYVTATPEGVSIGLLLAGPGSRSVAYIIDFVITETILGLLILLVALVAGNDTSQTGWTDIAVAGVVVGSFVVQYGYFVLFEVAGDGRSPGKRMTGLRVVNLRGGPVGLRRSLVRNLLRIIDQFPGTYIVGLISVMATPANQRLGDLAAGTIVVRYRPEGIRAPAAPAAPAWGQPASAPAWSGVSPAAVDRGAGGPALRGWDVTAVTPDEVTVIRQFLVRRDQLPWPARYAIAVDLANRLWPKVAGQPAGIDPESFLSQLATEKLSGSGGPLTGSG